MSLYHEAAEILTTAKAGGGSLKSLALGRKTWKTDKKTLYALTAETAKWSEILSEVIEKSGLLKAEHTVSVPRINSQLSRDKTCEVHLDCG